MHFAGICFNRNLSPSISADTQLPCITSTLPQSMSIAPVARHMQRSTAHKYQSHDTKQQAKGLSCVNRSPTVVAIPIDEGFEDVDGAGRPTPGIIRGEGSAHPRSQND